MQLYITSAIMITFATVLCITVAKLSKLQSDIYKKDLMYMKRFDAIEGIVKKDIKTILEILKK